MDSKNNIHIKAMFAFSAIVSFTFSTTAQIGERNIPGTDFTVGGTISEAIDTILFWDLGSGAGFWLGLTMFIVVWLGIHFATRPFLQQIFEAMLDHFPSSDSRRNINRNDEGEIKGINALSLLAAFATAQLIGQFLGLIPLIILGILPVSMAAWGTYKGSSSFRNDFGEYLQNDTDLDNQNEPITDGGAAADAGGEANEALNQVDNEQATAESQEQRAEEDVEAGNTQRADEEANQAADNEQNAIQDMEIAAKDIDKLLEIEENQLRETLKELNQTRDELVYEEEIIEKLQDDLKKANTQIREWQSEYTNNLQHSDSAQSLREAFPLERISKDIPESIDRMLNESSALVQRLSDEVKENRREISRESDEIDTELKEALKAKKLINKLKSELEEGESLDQKIENLAEKLSDSDLYQEAETEIQEENQIERQIRTLLEMEEDIEKGLKRELEVLKKISEIDKEEIEELKQENGEFGEIRDRLPRLIRSLRSLIEDNEEGPAVYYVDDNPETPAEITQERKNEAIDNLNRLLSGEESQIEQIERALEEIIEAKKQNKELENKMISEIENQISN